MFQVLHKLKRSKGFCRKWCQEKKRECLEMWERLYNQVDISSNEITSDTPNSPTISKYTASTGKLLQAIQDLAIYWKQNVLGII